MTLNVFNNTANTDLVITIIIIIGIIVLLLVIAFAMLFPIFKKKYMYRNFKMVYYRKIYSIAEKNDYLLLNNIILKNKDIKIAEIDHILFAKKYIYVIKDRFYRGAISGNKDDNVWLFFNNRNEKTEMHNPMQNNVKRIEKLCSLTGLQKDFFISIVVVNNDCVIKNAKELNSKRSFIVSSKKLPKLIKSIEKRNLKDIDQRQLEDAVRDIYRLYGRGNESEDE